ncbi:MAG: hypothetical protein AB1512_10980 [Thermodesulfobacteriota bacterium]
MRRKTRPLLALIGILVVAGGVSLFKKTLLIEMTNLDRPVTVRIRIDPSEPVFIFHINSIYDQPVTETLEAGAHGFVLRGVETPSPAVMEYYGFEAAGGVQPVRRELGNSLILKKGPRRDQGVLLAGRRVLLSEIAEEGDRIRLEVKHLPLGLYWWNVLTRPISRP